MLCCAVLEGLQGVMMGLAVKQLSTVMRSTMGKVVRHVKLKHLSTVLLCCAVLYCAVLCCAMSWCAVLRRVMLSV